MSRPAAEIILSTEVDDFNGIDVLTASALYTVLYKDRPINLKTRYWNARGEFKKYLRTTYPSIKPAENLANKLNLQFNCSDFTAKKII
jgi:hypothetical protein